METKDLDSYYPGYEDRKSGAKVPYEDYAKLEEKIKVYESALSELEEIIYDTDQYSLTEKNKLSKAILEDVKRFL